MLPCFRDLGCGVNTFLTSSQNKTCSLMVLSREMPSCGLGLSPTLGQSLNLGKCKTRTVGDVADPSAPNLDAAAGCPSAKGSCFVCSMGTWFLNVMSKGFHTDIKQTSLSVQLPYMILDLGKEMFQDVLK